MARSDVTATLLDLRQNGVPFWDGKLGLSRVVKSLTGITLLAGVARHRLIQNARS